METATATPVKEIPIAPNTQLEEVLRIFDAQKKNAQNVKNTTVAERLKKIKKLRQVVFANRDKIQKALWADFHKPATQVDLTEIVPIISEAKNFEANLYDWAADREVDTPLPLFGTSAKIVLEPKGNALFLTPWNYPFQLIIFIYNN